MRFPHNAKIFRGQLDAAPFVGVFFLLLIFLLVQTTLVFTPGIPIQLPETASLPGVTNRTVALAVDADGLIYFDNQITPENELLQKLRQQVTRLETPLTLVIQADRSVPYETLVRLSLVARNAGIHQALLATRPPVIPHPYESLP